MVTLPSIAPMLASPGRLPLPGGDDRWAVETKQDGQRVLAYLPGDGTALFRSRSGENITAGYPELQALGDVFRGTPAVLDGEIVALDERGRADFGRLASRMGLVRSPAAVISRAARRAPVHLVLFDVVFLSGDSLLAEPYAERREVLESLGLAGACWSVPAVVVGSSAQALEATRAAGLEGIVCKRLTSRYEPGVRSRSWIKIRNLVTTDAIIGGWMPGKGRLARPARGASARAAARRAAAVHRQRRYRLERARTGGTVRTPARRRHHGLPLHPGPAGHGRPLGAAPPGQRGHLRHTHPGRLPPPPFLAPPAP